MRPASPTLALLAAATLMLLSGCGGDAEPIAPTEPPPSTAQLEVDCSGPRCGAIDAHRYAGSGIGVWQYTNTGDERTALPIRLAGVAGKDVQLIYTNHGDTPQRLPALELYLRSPYPLAAPAARLAFPAGADAADAASPRRPRHPDLPPMQADPMQRLKSRKPSPAHRIVGPSRTAHAPRLGDVRTWRVSGYGMGTEEDAFRRSTLVRQTVARDGRGIHVWIDAETQAAGSVTDAMLDGFIRDVAQREDAVYDRTVALVGPPWGPYPEGELPAIPPDADLHVAFIRDMMAAGMVHWNDVGLNDPAGPPEDNLSNEALVLFMSDDNFYNPVLDELASFAHELTHLSTRYLQVISKEPGQEYFHQSWFIELIALMAEDALYLPGLNRHHENRDFFVRYWLRDQNFNCDILSIAILDWGACDSYNINSTIGAYLLRHYGMDFYRRLLNETGAPDSWRILDKVIRDVGGPGIQTTMRRIGTTSALLPAASPPNFGLGARSDSGYDLVPMDGALYADYGLPTSVPMYLQPRGFFPFVRPAVRDVYEEVITVPPRTSVSVVIR